VIGGAAATTLSLAGLRVSRGESRELLVQSNMLSEVFKHPSDVDNVYPQVVVSFMDSIAPNDADGLSRQDRLIKNWVDLGRIPDPKTPEGQEKVNRLASLPGQKVKQTIADLDDRQAMLYDLRVRLNYMKLDLAILLASLPQCRAAPGAWLGPHQGIARGRYAGCALRLVPQRLKPLSGCGFLRHG